METHPDSATMTCIECENDIVPGDHRSPTANGTAHTACANRQDARNKYRFFIQNPAHAEPYSMSLHYDAGDKEYPVVENTGGLTTITSASKQFGGADGIEPTPHFMEAFAYTYHWLQSYRPLPSDTERISKEIDQEITKYYPNGKIPSHEEWALHTILMHLYLHREVPPEFGPIVDCCDDITAFSVPTVRSY